MRVRQSRSPPVVGRVILLPQQPDFARAFGEQIFTRETHGDGKPFRAFTDKHYVAGVLHDGFSHERNILDVTHAAHGSRSAWGSMHAAGVKFDNPLFVGKAAESDRIVIRIIFRSLDNAHGGVERVAAAFQESKRVVEVIDAICAADDDRPLRAAGWFGGAGNIVLTFVLRIQAGGQRCSDCGTQKSATAYGHEFSVLGKRREGYHGSPTESRA